ncbi:hypothetical protein C5167_034678 [Papaver somniferum]|uniref:MSP domain-containing protein n=1 Tax=Papaver somniferum TaxID=3469 RepID=A0A4Y7KHH2_PAPSO|nr:hypothetical protein C5167_034678 [Papaver somniferum]
MHFLIIESRKQSSSSLQLTNKTDEYVAFKVKTTNPKKYCVRPNTGIVLPGTTFVVTVTMQAQKEAPQDMQCKDKFLLQSVTAPKGATAKDITPEMFCKESGKLVEEFFLWGIYIPVSPMVLEVSSSRASDVENGIQETSLFDVISKSLLMGTSSGDPLNLQPTELTFPFELRKQISCSLQLTNNTDEYVAFKVIYVPANVPEGTEEGSSPRASGVENGSQETYLLDVITTDTLQQRNLYHCSLRRRILHQHLHQRCF